MRNTEKIAIIGAGYVGMSLAVLLARQCALVVVDIDSARVDAINNGISPIGDPDIEKALAAGGLNLYATQDMRAACAAADFIIVATPTDYDATTGQFDTRAVDSVVADALAQNAQACIIIKSTVPVGHCRMLQAQHKTDRIIFAPEFLREGQALHDNRHPSRIIIGADTVAAHRFAALLQAAAEKPDIETLFMQSDEAEAVKLFANTYLAMRVSFFNELDSYAMARNLDAGAIIKGVSLDARIGDYYNNPSFGYGGYCLPKDTRQLLANYEQVPQNLIEAVVTANDTRKNFIANQIIAQLAGQKHATIGIYRLAMKSGADNARSSAILGVIEKLSAMSTRLILYEPTLAVSHFEGCEVVAELADFKQHADIIIANRMAQDLHDVRDKVFTRDRFGQD